MNTSPLRLRATAVLVFGAAFAVAPTLCLQTAAHAQGPGAMSPASAAAARKAREDRMKAVAVKLKMTDAQQAKIKAVQDDIKKQIMALRTNPSLTEDQKRTKTMALAMGMRDKVMAVLTPAQKAQLKQMEAEQSAKMAK